MNILVIGAHFDDEVLGVGGTILKHLDKEDEVYACIVTLANDDYSEEYRDMMEKQWRKVSRFLGVEYITLDFPSLVYLYDHHKELNDKIGKVINQNKPDIIYSHSPSELHYDHQCIYEACYINTRAPKRIKLICFETTEPYQHNKPFKPNYYIDITSYIDKKLEALSIYKSEMLDPPHWRSLEGIKALAKYRGSLVSMEYAECFKIIRDWWV